MYPMRSSTRAAALSASPSARARAASLPGLGLCDVVTFLRTEPTASMAASGEVTRRHRPRFTAALHVLTASS